MVAQDILDLTFFPKGTILMFSGTDYVRLNSALWHICDGTGGTPNLLNKFIRGAAVSGGTGGKDSDSVKLTSAHIPAHAHGLSSGAVSVSGTIGNANGHTHTVSGTISSAGAHTHTVSGTVDSGGGHTHGITDPGHVHTSRSKVGEANKKNGDNYVCFEGATNWVDTTSATTGITINNGGAHGHTFSSGAAASAGGHNHTFSDGTAGSAGGHNHTFSGSASLSGNTGSYGTADAAQTAVTIATIPGYYALVYVMKIV
jgi:hypothetical protein